MGARDLCIVSLAFAVLGTTGCQNDRSRAVSEQRSAPTPAAPVAAVTTMTDSGAPGVEATPKEGAAPAGGVKDGAASAVSAPKQSTDRFADYVPPKRKPQEMTLVSRPVTEAPTIDGRAEEPTWKNAPAITTLDYSSQREITIKSVFTSTDVFFLVTFPDDTASENHKTWVWDPKEEVYREGPDREDVFIFKWSMSGNNVSMRLQDPEPHRGDIWFWKARRTNPAGYADDKWQAVSLEPGQQAKKVPSKKYGSLYFRRVADEGEPAFEEKFFFQYQGDRVEKFAMRQPQGSRADVRAKGIWANGQWTIEFGRKLVTGYDDDVAFTPGRSYLFAVSCYAMALDTAHQAWSQPLYRTGDVFDRLLFTMSGRAGK